MVRGSFIERSFFTMRRFFMACSFFVARSSFMARGTFIVSWLLSAFLCLAAVEKAAAAVDARDVAALDTALEKHSRKARYPHISPSDLSLAKGDCARLLVALKARAALDKLRARAQQQQEQDEQSKTPQKQNQPQKQEQDQQEKQQHQKKQQIEGKKHTQTNSKKLKSTLHADSARIQKLAEHAEKLLYESRDRFMPMVLNQMFESLVDEQLQLTYLKGRWETLPNQSYQALHAMLGLKKGRPWPAENRIEGYPAGAAFFENVLRASYRTTLKGLGVAGLMLLVDTAGWLDVMSTPPFSIDAEGTLQNHLGGSWGDYVFVAGAAALPVSAWALFVASILFLPPLDYHEAFKVEARGVLDGEEHLVRCRAYMATKENTAYDQAGFLRIDFPFELRACKFYKLVFSGLTEDDYRRVRAPEGTFLPKGVRKTVEKQGFQFGGLRGRGTTLGRGVLSFQQASKGAARASYTLYSAASPEGREVILAEDDFMPPPEGQKKVLQFGSHKDFKDQGVSLTEDKKRGTSSSEL